MLSDYDVNIIIPANLWMNSHNNRMSSVFYEFKLKIFIQQVYFLHNYIRMICLKQSMQRLFAISHYNKR